MSEKIAAIIFPALQSVNPNYEQDEQGRRALLSGPGQIQDRQITLSN